MFIFSKRQKNIDETLLHKNETLLQLELQN